MSSDPIEVLRELPELWRESAIGWDKLESGQDASRWLRTCADELDASLASLSAPKGDLTVEELVEVLGGIVYWSGLDEVSIGIHSDAKVTGEVENAVALLNARMAPKPESAEAVIPWVREWKGSGPQRGFHIREATRLHNNRVVAYLGDQVDGDEVDKLIAEHNGKHPNGDPVRPAPPRPEANKWKRIIGNWQERVAAAGFNGVEEAIEAIEASIAPQQASAPAPSAGDAADGWQHLASDWLEQQAEEQEATNAEYPKHAAAYSEWRDRPVFLRMLAEKVKKAEGSIKRHCPPPSWMFPDDPSAPVGVGGLPGEIRNLASEFTYEGGAPEVMREWADRLERALAQQPAAEYADAEALIAHLDTLCDESDEKWDVAQAAIAGIRTGQQ